MIEGADTAEDIAICAKTAVAIVTEKTAAIDAAAIDAEIAVETDAEITLEKGRHADTTVHHLDTTVRDVPTARHLLLRHHYLCRLNEEDIT